MSEPPVPDGGSIFPGFSVLSEDVHAVVVQLAEHRRAAGISQTEIAARMRTSQSAVARLESGQGDIRLSTLRRYADAMGHQLQFGVRPDDPQEAGS